jgi:trk system potassium uptake protein TrkH
MDAVALVRAMRTRSTWVTPARSLLIGFSSLTALGTLFLSLPIASEGHTAQPILDALFTATSAVTTTGLIVVDTGGYYSLFGEIVILALFQLGGLGYMAFIAFLAMLMGRRLSLGAGATLQQSMAGFSLDSFRPFVRRVFVYTALFEVIGTLVFGLRLMAEHPPVRAFYLGLFHSVSAFCTAGFSLFADSFMGYADSVVLNVAIAFLSLGGATGFFALHDLRQHLLKWLRRERPRRLSLHTKLMLSVSLPVMVGGSALLLVSEPASLLGMGAAHRLATATFQAISASTTTGFNTVDIGAMSATGLFAIILIMFVGASPGGTGGGIKTTTLATVLLAASRLLRGEQETQAYWRRIPDETVRRALAIGLMATALVAVATLSLTATEEAPFLGILFEVVSAAGTVGLSTGVTPSLTDFGKIVISVVMLIGRLGPLAIGYALLAVQTKPKLRYAAEEVFIG